MSRSSKLRLCVAISLAVAFAAVASPKAAPRLRGDELKRSWGIEAIGTQTAYGAGITGRGVTIALVDCGVRGARRELTRHISKRSTDMVAARKSPDLEPHGAWVASPIAAARDGFGMVGVAYNATILSIRADMDGGMDGACAFRPGDLARGLDYAVEQNARIIVLPLQARRPLGDTFERALARVADSGAVVVIAAGNYEEDEPSWPARYAADPRYAGSIVVAGASSYYGALTAWTNRAGSASPYYVAAPGEWVLTNCSARCKLVSGTSFSTSYVAGALALIMEAHPDLNGREAARRLLDASRDLGEAGPDPVYGRGMLDLSRAFGG